jgi:YVTN family beta-propeller protein
MLFGGYPHRRQSHTDPNRDRTGASARSIAPVMRAAFATILAPLALPAAALAAGPEGPPERPDTHQVMFVGNNWDGTADIVGARNFRRLGRINTIPDREERMREIFLNPAKAGFFLGIRQLVGEGNDQFTDDMFTSHDGRFVYVSRPSFADVVGIELATGRIVWRFPMEGYRADHMAISPDGRSLMISDSTGNKVHRLDTATGRKTGEFASGDSPHETNYTRDGARVFHASIGRVYTPSDRPELGLARDSSKGARYFQINDARSLALLKRWDMGQKLEEAGHPEMESAVRPMALDPEEDQVYLQISFHHGFVEFDVPTERVLRIANLPVSEEASKLQREEYLLDSAHHGLAMNAAGTKLCAAGTMSDYAAIVSRATFAYKLFAIGRKPYWSTNGLNDTCWLSSSGDDRVVVLDYNTEREVARVPVGDHPQRVRLGAVNRASLPGLPPPPGVRDRRAPHIGVRGRPRRCRRSNFRLRVRIVERSALRSAEVRLGSRRLRRTRRKNFSFVVRNRRLRPGVHRLRFRATDAAGNTARRTVGFRHCR